MIRITYKDVGIRRPNRKKRKLAEIRYLNQIRQKRLIFDIFQTATLENLKEQVASTDLFLPFSKARKRFSFQILSVGVGSVDSTFLEEVYLVKRIFKVTLKN